MYRVSKDTYDELGVMIEEAFNKSKENMGDATYLVRFNMLYFIEYAVRDLINERIQALRDEGVL